MISAHIVRKVIDSPGRKKRVGNKVTKHSTIGKMLETKGKPQKIEDMKEQNTQRKA